ncbi:putative FAD binding domain containing protein [Lyophyllum shimeji]|uniref:FAD binding domain containing protein n=1 Tax=Lyophyllum shimeji TaxID=47721 RepID=A0A9P3PQF5_LYOSH|nr:putative FAD binding domain containing protein [Lyophyllum shimeji]
MPATKFRVAVCGGGIAGLALAVALSKYPDIDVDIYEAATEFSEVGAGIGVWPRVWKILEHLGLSEDLARVTALKPSYNFSDTFIFRKSDQPDGLDFYKLQTQGSFLRYHRPDFLQVLMDHLPARYRTSFSHRIQSYTRERSGKISLEFQDGSTASCDILIGADGIKSAVRRSMLTHQATRAAASGRLVESEALLNSIEPTWTGIVAYRALIPTDRLKAYRDAHPDMKIRVPETNSIPTMYMGQHVNVVVYPISSGRLINIGAFHANEELAGTRFEGPWVMDVDKDHLLETHAHWEPELQAILQCVDKPSRWAIHASRPLKSWTYGNVALMGDAAHAMSPQQASGAGQAIEDAFILATLLGHNLTKLDTVSDALSIYDQIRRPVAMEVARRSLVNGRLFGLQLPGFPLDNEPERLPELGDAIKENWKWTWSTTLDADVKKAVGMLESRSASRAHL